MFNKPTSEAGLLIMSSCLAVALGVTKFKSRFHKFIHTLLCCLSLSSVLNKPTSEASLLIKSSCLAVSLSVTKFNNHYPKFIHTFLCHLSPT
jgi:hypothetical protein